MPTVKPRITITLTEQQHAVLSVLSRVQKVSMSSIVVDLVDTTLPVLERLAAILENAASAPQSVLDDLKKSLEIAESDAVSAQGLMMGNFDLLVAASSGVEQAVESVADVKPPTSNRGVRKAGKSSKILSVSPMKKGEKNGRVEK